MQLTKDNFINIDVHSKYSIQSSLLDLDKIISYSIDNKYNVASLIDDNGLYGAVKFYAKCVEKGLKPIIGTQLNICETISKKDKNHSTISLIPINLEGYKDLCKLITRSYSDGFYYVPRIDFELLKQYSANLICLLSGRQNILTKSFLNNQLDYATLAVERLEEIFLNRFYIGLNPYADEEYGQFINWAIKKFTVKFVITNSCRFYSPAEYEHADMVFCVKNKLKFKLKNRQHANPDEYFKSEDEIKSYFSEIGILSFPGSYNKLMLNNLELANSVDLKFERKFWFPRPNLKHKGDSLSEFKYLIKLGWRGKRENLKFADLQVYKDRLLYEMEVIANMGFIDYFLVVADIINWAKNNNIRIGPGRGSATGSLISYLLNITEVDPIRYNLIFERFLNPAGKRVTPPDIDFDVQDTERDRLIEYISNTYGTDNVVSVGNLSTLAFKSSIKDVAKALGIAFERANEYTKSFPFRIKEFKDLKKDRKLNAELSKNEEFRNLTEYADGIKGSMKNLATHASGVIVSPLSITDFTPVQYLKSTGKLTTQLDKDSVEYLGLLKIDVLGLTALSIVENTLKLVAENHKKIVDINSIDLNDKNIFKHILRGHTTGIFQLEGNGMTDLAKKIKVSSLNEIRDLISLYRPAILEQKFQDIYIKNKKMGKFNSIHPVLENVTKDTYGILLFQEQVMQTSVEMAKFTYSESDVLRKTVAKKSSKDIPILKKKFINGCSKNNIPQNEAEEIFSIFENASYCFCAAHGTSYAIISCQTAWLKYYYPLEFMTACLNAEYGNLEKIATLRDECAYLNIEILPPDIEFSQNNFVIESGKIRYGFKAIKDMGESFGLEIKNLDSKNSIRGFLNILSKNNLLLSNKSKIETLILCGAFDRLRSNRKELVSELNNFLKKEKEDLFKGRRSKNRLFDVVPKTKTLSCNEDYVLPFKKEFEKSHLGFCIS